MSDKKENIIKYKIILTKPDNIVASDIYSKIKYITSTDKRTLVCNTEKYIYNHILLPIYEKKDVEEIKTKYKNLIDDSFIVKTVSEINEIINEILL